MDAGQTVTSGNVSGGLIGLASREKFWSELTADEKVERMRLELKKLQSKYDEQETEIYRLKNVLTNHQHNDFGQVMVSESLVKKPTATHFGRLTDKSGNEVYF